MALTKTIVRQDNFDEAITFVNCYLKVIEVVGSKERVNVRLGYFKNKEGIQVDTTFHKFVPSMDSNFIAQAYEHLKTLPEFADAVDC